MSESTTRLNLINPQLKAAGWGVVEGSRILCEHPIRAGRITTGGHEQHSRHTRL